MKISTLTPLICGERGEKSHGGSWDDAPESVKECARNAGFQGDGAKKESLSAKDWALLGIGGIVIVGGIIFVPEVAIPGLILGGAASR